MRFVGILLTLTALLPSATPVLKLDPEAQALVDLTGSAPPEFGADALLQLVESEKVTDRDTKIELINRAFRLAAMASYKMPLRTSLSVPGDSETATRASVYKLKLDVLSLSKRAISDMLPLDKLRARDLFQQIPRPVLGALTCDDLLVPDVSAYYETLAQVVQGTFRPEERKKEEHISFLLDYLSGLTSPLQLTAATKVLQTVDLTGSQRAVVTNRIAGAMETMDPDPRSFASAEGSLDAIMTRELRPSYEKLLARCRKAKPCEDGIQVSVGTSLDAMRPPPLPDPAKAKLYWTSGGSKAILALALRLRFNEGHVMLSAAERATPEWRQQLTDFLSAAGDWKADVDEPAEVYFAERSAIYTGLAELIAAGPERDRVVNEFIAFANNSNFAQQSPVDWFQAVRRLYVRVSSSNGAEPTKMLDSFRMCGNPILALFAAEQSSLPAKPMFEDN